MSIQQIKDLGLILLLTLVVLIPQLAGFPLLEPDEARYVEIPREMVENHDYLIPRLNSIIYLEKPPLFYWLQTLPLRFFGIHEIALRFWNAFFASFTCGMIYLAGSTLYNRKTGWIAAGLLFSSLLLFTMAHFITLDMTTCALITGSLVSVLIGLNKATPLSTRLWMYSASIFAALAMLTKGLIGVALPGSIFILWVIATGQWSALRRACIPSSLLLFLAITLPWHLLVQARIPEFFDFYFITQHFNRYLTMAEQRYQPFWYFGVILFAGLVPWVFFALAALFRQINQIRLSFKQYPTETFLLIWTVFIFLFFSLSKSKLVPYILPVLPPIMLLLSHDLLTYRRKPWEWIATLGFCLISGLGLFALPYFAKHLLEPELLANYRIIFFLMGGICLGSFILCTILVQQQKIRAACVVLAAGALLVFSTAIPTVMKLADRSIKPLAEIIRLDWKAGDEIVAFLRYFQDLPVYTGQTVTVVDRQGELDFGMSLEDHSAHMITQKTFLQRWTTPGHRMFVVMSHHKYEEYFAQDPRAKVLGATSRYILISN